jgi:ABC-type nickel/cobalt efflux system permease component RcnA
MARLAFASILAIVALVLLAPVAQAHPLGNFTINRYTRIELAPESVRLFYVLDMAEVPAFQEIRTIDTNRNQVIDRDEETAYLDVKVGEVLRNLAISVDGAALAPEIQDRALTFPPGLGGLATLRIETSFEARMDVRTGRSYTLAYEDRNYADRLGWKEVVARALDGVSIEASSVPASDRSDELRSYPEGGLNSPLDVRAATVTFMRVLGAVGVMPDAKANTRPAKQSSDPLGRLLRRESLTLPVIGLALIVAAGIGGFHALTPGHGKTIMAAYLLGTRGRARHVVMLGATVAVSHTIGVLALGALAVYAANVIAPDRVYPYLGLAAGVIVLAIGLRMLFARLVVPRRHEHSHVGGHQHSEPDHEHSHDEHAHDHAPAAEHTHDHAPVAAAPRSGVTWRTLLAIGLADGAVPSASALVVWLAAISIDRVEFGLVMVAAFGIGMAAALTAVGFLLVRGRAAFENRFVVRSPMAHRLSHAMPWLTALFVVGAGLFLMVRAAGQSGLF